MEKQVEYAVKLASHVSAIFEDEDNPNYINLQELNEGQNLTHFVHALSTMMPNKICDSLTNENRNNLEHNHMANSLLIQYVKIK